MMSLHRVQPMACRALAKRCRRGQGGFTLLAAIVVMLVLTLATVALLQMALGAGNLSSDLAVDHQYLRAADSGLVDAAQRIRSSTGEALASSCPNGTGSGPYTYEFVEELSDGNEIDVVVTCTLTSSTATTRTVQLDSRVGTSTQPLGRARIKYVNAIGDLVSPGYTMTICDWRLGSDSTALALCP